MVDPYAVIRLAEELDGLPLALATAGAYHQWAFQNTLTDTRHHGRTSFGISILRYGRTKTECFTLPGRFHLTMSNNGMNFRPSFFSFGHTLIIRISGLSFFGTVIQRTQSGYVSLPKT